MKTNKIKIRMQIIKKKNDINNWWWLKKNLLLRFSYYVLIFKHRVWLITLKKLNKITVAREMRWTRFSVIKKFKSGVQLSLVE